MAAYIRPFVSQLEARLMEPAPLLQVLLGPRQVGKTTGLKQLLARWSGPWHYASADDLLAADRNWLIAQWQTAQRMGEGALLVIDEIQKVPNWTETVKALWDAAPRRLRVVLLGSSALDLQAGLTESLAGRFELTRVLHWSYAELAAAFGYDLERYLRFGGYPGAVAFEEDFDRWYGYLKDAVVEAAIGRDILHNRRVVKPALFRQAFEILCHYPAQEISYTKLLGQLQDRGNTDLVKYYLELYGGAFLIHALQKYSAKAHRVRASSPKILPACPALATLASGPWSPLDPQRRGRAFELAVGVELMRLPGELFYWREKHDEVDYVCRYRGRLFAIEVKSGRRRSGRGLDAFRRQFPESLPVIVTPENFAQLSAGPGEFLLAVAEP